MILLLGLLYSIYEKTYGDAHAKLEKSSNFQIYPQGGKSDPLPPFKTARGQSELFTFQCDWSFVSIYRNKKVQIFRFTPRGVNLTPLPPFETARGQSELCFSM